MAEEIALSRVGMHVVRGCLIVSIQAELYDEVVYQIQRDVLAKINDTGVKGVVLDVSTIEVIDSFIAQTFADTARMASLLGARTILIGVRPALAGALIDLGATLPDVHTALTLDQALLELEPFVLPGPAAEDVPEDSETEEEAEYCEEDAGSVTDAEEDQGITRNDGDSPSSENKSDDEE